MNTSEKHVRNNSFVRVITGLSFLLCSTFVFGQSASKEQAELQLLNDARVNIEKYRKGNAVITLLDRDGKKLRNAQVEINQLTQDFLFGNLSEEIFNPNLTVEEVSKYRKYFADLFNFTELTVKWTPYEGKQGKPQWAALQKKLDWCRENNITPKGHTIGWTNMSGTPPWLLKLPLETTYELHKARTLNLVGGFKDQIKMWDVVNEPVTTVPWEVAMKDSVFGKSLIDAGDRYNTNGITLEHIIPWVEKSLRWAYEADPQADLMLNEFYVIAKPDIREKFYLLIKELQKRNVPLTGIGIQAHEPREMWFSPLEIVATYNKYQELGIPLHITEFIPQSSMKEITGGWRKGLWTEEAQAEFAEQFYTLSFGHPAIASIHWWGLTDKMIWLDGGGLLDKELNPKPVYNRLHKLIKEDWMTRNLRLNTRKDGQISFRGFYGRYRVVVREPGGSQHEFEFHLKEGEENNPVFRLNGELIFQSGFEETSRVIPFDEKNRGNLTPGFACDEIVGADNTFSEKNDWVKDLDEAPDGGQFLLEYTGGDETQRHARIIPEPGNPGNKVLRFWLKDSWLASENQVKARVQANIYSIKKPYKEFYQSVRVYLHEDFNALKKYPRPINWLTISEFWNNEWWVEGEQAGFRITLGIGKSTADESELNFILEAENAGQINVWKAHNTNVKVPIGKWFTMEYYFKEGNKETGRFYMAITPDGGEKQVIFDVHDYTHNTFDLAPNGLSGYNPMKLYTSKELVSFMKNQDKILQIYWDDLKLWKNKQP